MRICSLRATCLITLLLHAAAPTGEALTQERPSTSAHVHGRVIDASGGAISGARVILSCGRSVASVVTSAEGHYDLQVAPGACTLQVSADGFVDATRRITPQPDAATTANVTLAVAGIHESVSVGGLNGYGTREVSSATRTPTPLRDVPQAISVVSRALIADQRMTSMADVARYMPGVGFAQGEGNRDTPVLRGNSTTADFFVDGVRDDVQYFRDVYNVDRVEALKGANALVFGRGGGGGVINRVTRQAEWVPDRELSLQLGSWDNKRVTGDLGRAVNDTVAFRATAMYEDSDSYRNGVSLERYGINPTAAFRLGSATMLRASYEFFHDQRVADRGIPSWQGRPVETDASTFFGDPSQSLSDATVHLASTMLEHRFTPRLTLRTRLSFGAYDKFYQNVFPGAVNTAGAAVSISAYNNATTRENLFSQTDAILTGDTGRIGHTILVGSEFGRQDTSNLRMTGYFTGMGPDVASYLAPLADPTISVPIAFRPSANDADNDGVTTIAAVYAQDQIALGRSLSAIVGLRFESFHVDTTNHRTGSDLRSDDGLVSPRLGLVYRPVPPLSLYGSYSLSYLPRAGEQLASLSLTSQALDPEQFRNYEVGAKWDVRSTFAVTAAVYRLDRGNVAVPDPLDPTRSVLVDAQRSRGVELEVSGRILRAWTVAGGYAWQDGEITQSISPTALAGATLAQLPRHSVSLWNKVDVTRRLSAALGFIHRDDVFTSTDNLVVLPSWTRVDAALFYDATPSLRLQANVENVFDEDYYVNAHTNNNITPGSPRALRLSLTARF